MSRTGSGARRWAAVTFTVAALLGTLLAAPAAEAAPHRPSHGSKKRTQRDCAAHRRVCLTVTHTNHWGGIDPYDARRRHVAWIDVRRVKGYNKHRTYHARWLYKSPGGTLHRTRWKRATNYRGVAARTWGYSPGRRIDVRKGALLCGQIKRSSAKACVRIK